MAFCYHCGQNGSDYRRYVQTGYSQGTYYGKRTSHSTHTYHGIRSLCENCAFRLDKSSLVKSIALRWIIAIILFYFLMKN